jgi:hypothetical protein
MFKLISHLVIFALGAAVGVYWGVNHPSDAQRIADQEAADVALAKQKVLQDLNAAQPPAPAGATTPANPVSQRLQQMLQQAQSEYNTAKSKLPAQ